MLALKKELDEIYKYRYVIASFVETTLKIRYRRSYLGFVWTLLAPILHYMVIGVVFSVIVRIQMPNYFAYYFSGALMFSFFNSVLSRAPGALVSNEHFIKKVAVPKIIFILNGVSYEAVNFLISGVALLLLGFFFSKLYFTIHLLWSLFSLIQLFFFLLGLACFLSVSTVYFRDFFHIIPIVLQAAFFLTPIVYSPDILPESYQTLLRCNPLVYFLEGFRDPLIKGLPAPIKTYFYCFVLSILTLFTGFAFLKKFENRIIFKL